MKGAPLFGGARLISIVDLAARCGCGCRPDRRGIRRFCRDGLATFGLGIVRHCRQSVLGERRRQHHRRIVTAELDVAPLHGDGFAADAQEATDRNDDGFDVAVLVE